MSLKSFSNGRSCDICRKSITNLKKGYYCNESVRKGDCDFDICEKCWDKIHFVEKQKEETTVKDFPEANDTAKKFIEKKIKNKCLNGHDISFKTFTNSRYCDFCGKSIDK